MSGTITFVGIVEPIAVGDNIQFDNTVYHIEQINHTATITTQGDKVIKTFRTTIMVSNGLDIESGDNVVYSEMAYGNAYNKRQNDYNTTQILPGVSEAQDVVYRPVGTPDGPGTPPTSNDSFIEPNTNTSINKSTRDS